MTIQPHPDAPQNPGHPRRNQWLNPAVWERRDMRLALAQRDIATVYRLLQRHGVSQRRIAALTEQSQGEVSEIITGKRQVVAYDLLVRIADGLGVSRGQMGLAFLDKPETSQGHSDERA
jgi:predicted XRE-type DNA-binding protein